MPRPVVQLLDTHSGFQATRIARALGTGLGPDFTIESIPVSSTLAATLRLRATSPDTILHAIGPRALVAAALAANKRRILYTPADEPRAPSIRWLRAAMSHRSIDVLCPSGASHRLYVTHGVPADRCHLLRPGVDFARARRRRDDALRTRLGFAPTDRVLLLVGESTRAANHRFAAWAGAILHVLDPKFRLLIWGRGHDAPGVAAFSRHQKQPALVTVATEKLGDAIDFEDLLPAADVALATANRPAATLPIAIAMAAGLPVVGPATDVVSELLEDRHNALLARPDSPKLLARRVLDLDEDPSLSWQIADTARAEAYDLYPLTRFLSHHRDAFAQAADGRPIAIEQPDAPVARATRP